MAKYIDLVNSVDNVPLDSTYSDFYRLLLPNDERTHGFMTVEAVQKMPWSQSFRIDHSKRVVQCEPSSNPDHPEAQAQDVQSAFQQTIDAAIASDRFANLHGDHSEPYVVMGARQALEIERFCAPIFGIATRGAHMTGYTRTADGEYKIWVARRSPSLFTYPGKLDTTVAGGVKAQHSPLRCIVEESNEEASLSKEFVASNVRSAGVITYMTQSERTGAVHPDVLFVFDLMMPAEMIPHPNDEEVSEFNLLTIPEIRTAMFNDEFKPNCTLVMIDFFLRHGIITPDDEPDYVQLQSRIHRKLPIPTSPVET